MRSLALMAALAAFSVPAVEAQTPAAPDKALCKAVKTMLKEAESGWRKDKITVPKLESTAPACKFGPDKASAVCTVVTYSDCTSSPDEQKAGEARAEAISAAIQPTMKSCLPAYQSYPHQTRTPVGDNVVFIDNGLKYQRPGAHPEIRLYEDLFSERSDRGVCQTHSLIIEVLRKAQP